MKKIFATSAWLVFLLFATMATAQSVSGNLSAMTNQAIRLEGFNGLKTYAIDAGQTDDKGNFKLKYAPADFGVGYLMTADNKPFFVILSGEDVEIKGEAPGFTETMQVLKGQQNSWFGEYASAHPRREQALSAWAYLEKIYRMDSLFSVQQKPSKAIRDEMQRIKDEDEAYIRNLPKESYVRWFLPTRRLVSSVSTVAQYRTEEIPGSVAAFRDMDYTDPRLYKSGLFKDAIESHFWLLENCGKPLDSVFAEMKISIDAMMKNLIKDPKKLNEVTNYLFDLLERHSLFKASEYLALKVLNDVSCTIDNDLSKQLETYRSMKKGNIAPDFAFDANCTAPGYPQNSMPKKLSDLKSKYTVVVFGASWCPKCKDEMPEIVKAYPKWQSQGVEVVFVSLDDEKDKYAEFVKNFPFVSTCDFKKWEGKTAKDYYVFGTPTIFLLDSKREILLRPNSVNQMDAWVDWYLVKKNQ